MPFPPTLGTDQDSSNVGFVATFQAYLDATVPSGELPVSLPGYQATLADDELASPGPLTRNTAGECLLLVVAFAGDVGGTSLASSGVLTSRSDFPPTTTGGFLGGMLGFVGSADSPLPTPPVPNFGPSGSPTQGAAGLGYPPSLVSDPGSLPVGSLFPGTESYFESRYFLGLITGFVGEVDGDVGTPPSPTPAIVSNPAPRAVPNDPIATFQGYLVASPEGVLFPLRLVGALDFVEPTPGPMGKNQNSDPAGAQVQLDGMVEVFVGEPEPPFTTSRLPRLAFGPFINLSGLTYQLELDAFAKFGLTQIKYRIYASDQSTPPYNTIGLAGLNTYVTNLVQTLGNAAADLHAEAILTDAFGNVATQSVVLLGIPDTLAPTSPPFLYIAQLPEGTWLFVWGTSQDNFAIDHYQIDQVDAAGMLIGTLAAGIRQNYYTLEGANLAGNHYRVLAFDPALNVSPASPIATAVANVAAEPQITSVRARQIPGTATVQVSWLVTPALTPCAAMVVDSLDRPLSDRIVSVSGLATLTLTGTIATGIYRVRVTTA